MLNQNINQQLQLIAFQLMEAVRPSDMIRDLPAERQCSGMELSDDLCMTTAYILLGNRNAVIRRRFKRCGRTDILINDCFQKHIVA